jgi:hypothetical protein
MVQPIEPDLLALEDIRVTRTGSKLWLGMSLLVGAGIVAALAMGGSDSANQPAARAEEVSKPEFGSLVVQADPGAEVWLFLGITPVHTMAIHNQEAHRIRVEHEGYHGVETLLGPDTWQRDENGTPFAQASVVLRPLEDPAPGTPYVGTELDAGARPAKIVLDSTPTAANAWLFVGTTPGVQIGNLRTSEEVQLRIIHGNHPPMYRSVPADQFDSEGRARLELALPAPLPPKKVEPAADKELEAKPQRVWRPRRETPPGPAIGKKPAKRAPLEPPTPEWAK